MRPLFIFEFLGCKPFKQYNLGPKFISDTDYGKSRRKVCFSRELRESLKIIDVIYWCNNYLYHMNAQPELKNKSHFIVDNTSASNQRLKKNDDN